MIFVKDFSECKKAIQDIDLECFDIVVDSEWYNKRYNNKAKVILYETNGAVAGYLLYCPITKAFYEALINDVLAGDYSVSPRSFLSDSEYIYVAALAVRKEYRGNGIATRLEKFMLNNTNAKDIVCLKKEAGYEYYHAVSLKEDI